MFVSNLNIENDRIAFDHPYYNEVSGGFQGAILTIFGVWKEGRNTPIVVDAEGRNLAEVKATRSGRAGANARTLSIRELKGKNLRLARQGKWVRERADGSDPTIVSERRKAARYKSKYRSGVIQQSNIY